MRPVGEVKCDKRMQKIQEIYQKSNFVNVHMETLSAHDYNLFVAKQSI